MSDSIRSLGIPATSILAPRNSLMTEPAANPDEPESDPNPQLPDPPFPRQSPAVQVADKVDSSQIAHFVMSIKNAEQQVGEHIIEALQYPDTVAVLTTVVMTPDGHQRVVWPPSTRHGCSRFRRS